MSSHLAAEFATVEEAMDDIRAGKTVVADAAADAVEGFGLRVVEQVPLHQQYVRFEPKLYEGAES